MAPIRRLSLLAVLAVALVAALGAVPAAADLVSRPSIESESASQITPTDVTLEAQINPGGRETTYEVWIGRYPECIEEQMEACESSGGGPAGTGAIVGTIPASFSSHTVSVDIADAWHKLSPNSSYIYSVSATNSGWAYESSAYGERKMFSTAAASTPAIKNESVSHITPTDATLEATINTEGFETSYEFQLRSPECMPPAQCIELINYPLPSGTLLGSFVDQSVSLDLNSAGVTLRPGWEYFYSATAKSAAGTTEGSSQMFTTPSPIAQPLSTAAPSTTSGGNQPGTSSTAGGPGGSSSMPGVTPFGPPLGTTTKPKALTNAQKLARALKLCAKKPKQRANCRKQAHKRYGTSGKQASSRKK